MGKSPPKKFPDNFMGGTCHPKGHICPKSHDKPPVGTLLHPIRNTPSNRLGSSVHFGSVSVHLLPTSGHNPPIFAHFQSFLGALGYYPRIFRDQFRKFPKFSWLGQSYAENMGRILEGVKGILARPRGGWSLFPFFPSCGPCGGWFRLVSDSLGACL